MGFMYAVVARCPLVTENKLAGRSSISLCRRVGCRRQYHSRLSTPSPKQDLVPTRGRIKSGRVQWCVHNWTTGRFVIGPTRAHTTRAHNQSSPSPFFLLASSPRPTSPPSVGNSFRPTVENRSHLSLRISQQKYKKTPLLIGQGGGLFADASACSLFFLSAMMTYPVISPVLDVIRMRCAPSLDPIAMDHHPCITPKE